MFAMKKRPDPRRQRRKSASSDDRFAALTPSEWRRWWQRKSRRVRNIRQDASAYVLYVCLAGSLAVVLLLWASGIFGEAGARLSLMTQRALAGSGLALEQVSVSGRAYTDRAALQSALRVERGMSILHFDLWEARQRIEKLDWVDHATIMRMLPDTLQITLTERRPIAIWQLSGDLMLIDGKGDVISGDHLAEFGNLLHVVGGGAATAAADLIGLMNAYPEIGSRVRAAIRVGGRRWNLRLDSGIDIKLPDQGEAAALELLTGLEKRHRLFARDVVEIDLRVPERLYLKLRDQDVVQFNAAGVKT